MRKIQIYLVVFMLSAGMFTFLNIPQVQASKNSNEFKTVKTYKEITDPNKLIERAKNQILEDKDRERVKATSSTLSLQKSVKTQKQKTYETSQLLEIKVNKKGDKIETYNFTTLAVEDGSGSVSDSKWDSTHGAKAYQTVQYNKYKGSRGETYYKLTRVKGGWKIADPKYGTSKRKVGFAVVGATNGKGVINKAQYKYPKGDTYNYKVPSSWQAIAKTPGTASKFGATASITLHKDGSKPWNLFLNNLLW